MKFTDVTPNLVVADIDRSIAFYRDVLGFTLVTSVPGAPPFVFAWMRRDDVSVFLNTVASIQEHAALASRPIGGTATLFMVVDADTPETGVDALFASVQGKAPLVMPLTTQFYGMREFAIEDPDGYIIFAAQRVGAPA
jgi:uncharacterized glyoxalase superfamily protein PhnB